MNPGKLDRRISFQAKSDTLDANGERLAVWSTFAENVAANVAPSGGREFLRASRVFETASAVFLVRYRKDITQEHRILYEGKAYNILSTEELGRKDGLLIVAQAINTGGAQ